MRDSQTNIETRSTAANGADEIAVIRRALGYLNAFRLFIALVAVVILFSPAIGELTPAYRLFLARAAALTYLLAALAFWGLQYRDTTDMRQLAAQSLATDLIIITVIMHCFGGLASGLGILLIFVIGIGALLLPLRTALLFAALTTLAIIAEALFVQSGGLELSARSVQAGLYGIAIFFTAAGCAYLGRWGRDYRLLAERRSVDLANLEQVNELIIHRMRTGVLVVSASNRIIRFNESAWHLLGSPPAAERRLEAIAPALAERLVRWRETGDQEDEGLLVQSTQEAVVPRFLPLPGAQRGGTLIFLEDTAVIHRRARDLAQASLARLSASIAHEIRNPLGAMSHAAQLLNESERLDDQDRRLLDIIQKHATRMNDIVENVLLLSRRERARPEHINLASWLRNLSGDFRRQHDLEHHRLRLDLPIGAGDLRVLIDDGHMHQVVWNLMENALRHASGDDHPAQITLRVSPIRDHHEIALDILDDGPGIPPEKRAQIFEPFFTTHREGSGLGLYLARQLCEANQAPLEYVQVPDYGACFRILLPRP